jgi:hypothetical protein
MMTKNAISGELTKDQIKDLVISTVKKEKPETAKQLIALMRERYAILPEQTTNLLIELENENRLYFTKQEQPTPVSAKEYIFSKKAEWYWITIAFSITAAILIFSMPANDYPIVFIRSGLAAIFVLLLPGYAFMRTLFPKEVPIETNSESMDTVERFVLSIGLSMVITPIVGLILNYTPWGIRLIPITLVLLAFIFCSSTAGIFRETPIQPNPTDPRPQRATKNQ